MRIETFTDKILYQSINYIYKHRDFHIDVLKWDHKIYINIKFIIQIIINKLIKL